MDNRELTVQARVGAARREATRERILEAARQMLERGDSVAELTVSKLAAEAEVSRATFYLHFPDKRQLLEALGAPSRDGWEGIADVKVADPDLTRDELKEIFRAGFQNWRDHASVFGSVIELAEYDPEARPAWRATIGASGEMHTRWLETLRPDLSPAERAALGEVLAWAGERSAHQLLGPHSDGRQSLDAVAEALTEIWWRVIRPGEGVAS